LGIIFLKPDKSLYMEQLLNLRHLLQHEVADLDSAEDQIIDALPNMTEMATSPELKKALNEHLKITREQKKRLERIQQLLNRDNREEAEKGKSFLERIFGGGTKCKGMEGLISEGKKMMSEDMDPQVRDAAIIASCQKIEHYEISGYGTARAYANQLNLVEVERLLQTTLNEEYKADDLLTVLALKRVNADAENSESAQGPSQGKGRDRSRSNGKPAAETNSKAQPQSKSKAPKSKSSNGQAKRGTASNKTGGSKTSARTATKGKTQKSKQAKGRTQK
jgi:ferritin-like metal-binding protein YciE